MRRSGLVTALTIASLLAFATGAHAMTARETAVFNQQNSQRTAVAESALSNNTTLYNCAKAWAQTMANAGKIYHASASQVTSCAGSGWGQLGENLAMVPPGFDVIGALMASTCHRDNILDATFSHVGVAMVLQNNTEFWAFRFGDSTSVSTGSITVIQNGCMDLDNAKDGVSWSAVRTRGLWHTYHDTGGVANIAVTNPGTPDANNIMRIDDPNPGSAQATQLVLGAAGKKYTLTAQALCFSGTAQSIYLDFLNSSYARISVKIVNAPTGAHSWTTVTTGAVTAPSGTAFVRVILYGPSASGTQSVYYWDDVRLDRQ